VLTRNEAAATGPRPAARDAGTTVRLVLSTVPAVNKADRNLYGGCVLQNCSIDQLVWVTIATEHAAPGKSLSCLPNGVPVPPHYKPRYAKQYYTVAVQLSYNSNCGPLPKALQKLTDLAPPAAGQNQG
jgi:hypothetical protein